MRNLIYICRPESAWRTSGRRKAQRNHYKRKKETRNSFGSVYPLQDEDEKAFKKAAGNCSEWRHSSKQENQVCLAMWKRTNLQGSDWDLLFRELLAITSRRKSSILSLITIWCMNVFQYPKWWKFWMRRLPWIKGKVREIAAWQMENWRAKKILFLKHKRERRKSPLCHIDGHLAS